MPGSADVVDDQPVARLDRRLPAGRGGLQGHDRDDGEAVPPDGGGAKTWTWSRDLERRQAPRFYRSTCAWPPRSGRPSTPSNGEPDGGAQRRGGVGRRGGIGDAAARERRAVEDERYVLVVGVGGAVRGGAAAVRVPARHEDPVRRRHQREVAAAAGDEAGADGLEDRVGRDRGPRGPVSRRPSARRAARASAATAGAAVVGGDLGAGGLGEIELRVFDPRDVRARAQPGGDQRLLDRRGRRGQRHAAARLPGRAARLGHRGHAVIGRQRQHVAVAADRGVERVEQRAERAVEPHDRVLQLVAVGAEVVADLVHGGEADAEEVHHAALPQLVASSPAAAATATARSE